MFQDLASKLPLLGSGMASEASLHRQLAFVANFPTTIEIVCLSSFVDGDPFQSSTLFPVAAHSRLTAFLPRLAFSAAAPSFSLSAAHFGRIAVRSQRGDAYSVHSGGGVAYPGFAVVEEFAPFPVLLSPLLAGCLWHVSVCRIAVDTA